MASKDIYGFIGGLILAVIATAGLLAAIGLIFGLLPGQENSEKPFQELTERIIDLEPGQGAQYNYFIGEGKVLVAFSKFKNEATRGERFLGREVVYNRPIETALCGPTNACLCLCDSEGGEACKKTDSKCVQFPRIRNIGGIIANENGDEIIKDKEEVFIEGSTNILLKMQLDQNSDLTMEIPTAQS